MRAQILIEKLTTSLYSNAYKPIYVILNKKRQATAVIHHDEAKDKFWLVTFKMKGNVLNHGVIGALSRANNNMLSLLGLPLVELPIKEPREVMGYFLKAAKSQKFLKKNYGELKKDDFLNIMTTKEAVPIPLLRDIIPDVEFTTTGSGTKDGNINIIGGKPKEIETARELLKDTAKLYKTIGMGKLMYGDIYLTTGLGKGKLADYFEADDNIRLSSRARKASDSVRTLIHELAHRWYYKFMSNDQREQIRAKFNETMASIGGKASLAIGDEYNHPKYGHIVIEDKDYNKKTYAPYFVFRALKDNTRYRIPDVGSLRGAKKTKGTSDIFDEFDVTNYSRTSPIEFFPEVVATALVDKNKTLLEWVKGFIKK